MTEHTALKHARILIVDDEAIIRDILARKLSSVGYQCESCENGRVALRLLTTQSYDVLLADIKMPELGGVELLREAQQICPDVAVILVTSVVEMEVAIDSIKDGAYDYITKPFSLDEVTRSVDRALEKRRLVLENRERQQLLEEQVTIRTRQLRDALDVLQHTYHSTLLALGTALDSRDAGHEGHSLRVTLFTSRLARQVGVNAADLREIEQGALLHDIGKIGLPDDLLRKSGKLSEDEWLLMRKHPQIGYRILSGINFLQSAAQLVLHHQERFDGSGYPAGLKGNDIALGARIFAVADTLDCMTSNRPFQQATTFEAARDEIIRVAGSQLDPAIVQAFLEIPLEEWKAIRREVGGRVLRSN